MSGLISDATTIPEVDVVVVGAGLSGLAAADGIIRAGKSVAVLEARDRVGGKLYDPRLQADPGHYIEAGGSYIGPGQHRVKALADRLGISTYDTYDTGNQVLYQSGQRIVFDPADPSGLGKGVLEYVTASSKLEAMAQELDIAAPWSHANARAWDSRTVGTWLDDNMADPGGRALMELSIRSLLSADSGEISLLQVLTYIARATDGDSPGTWHRLTAVRGGGQDQRIRGGPQGLAVALAATLPEYSVHFGVPVTRVTRLMAKDRGTGRPDTFQVWSETGSGRAVVTCRAVIVALSPPLAMRIRFEPPLPAQKDLMAQNLHMGSLGKVVAVYKTPFWRQEGLSGQALALDGTVVQLTYDASPEDEAFGAIQGFLEANELRELAHKSDNEVLELVKKDYVTFFGPQAADVIEWHILRWNDEHYSRGGHCAIAGPNAMTQHAQYIAEPVGNIFFAGTEASTRWAGFMEGAVIAGENAAHDTLAAL